jgi:hypothetical protein
VAEREQPLTGGRVTPGVVRIGQTVRRPLRGNSEFVRRLLAHLEAAGFEGAPRYLGSDEAGRELFSFVPGIVPDELDATLSDDTLVAAARLIRRFHDAKPVAMIDFDAAAPGSRLDDLGYALFLWLNLGTDGPPAREQARRIRLFCRAYGCEATSRIIQAVVDAVRLALDRLDADALPWWREQRRWLDENRDVLV